VSPNRSQRSGQDRNGGGWCIGWEVKDVGEGREGRGNETGLWEGKGTREREGNRLRGSFLKGNGKGQGTGERGRGREGRKQVTRDFKRDGEGQGTGYGLQEGE